MPIGRFAPSPTGPLHMGSLMTALASYLDIKRRGGEWYVRIDDIDPPRLDRGAERRILASLNAHGLLSDRAVDHQSTHESRYAAALHQLQHDLFYCTCSRKQLQGTTCYPGTCRSRRQPVEDAAVRLLISQASTTFDDAILGTHTVDLVRATGDFIVKRRDGLWSYNFATAVDDGHDVTHVLRGQDLFRHHAGPAPHHAAA